MIFRFFGDSWFWSWYLHSDQGMEENNFCQSKAMEILDSERGRFTHGLSVMRMFLERMGYPVYNYAEPGAGFQNTRHVHNSKHHKGLPSIDIIFTSSNLRRFFVKDNGSEDTLYTFNFSSKENFLKSYNDKLLSDLKSMMKYKGVETNNHYLLVSGQELLPREIFDTAKDELEKEYNFDLSNWHLLSESILVDLACNYHGQALDEKSKQEKREFMFSHTPRFGLCGANEIGLHLEDDVIISEEVIKLFEQHKETFKIYWGDNINFYPTLLLYPDYCHLGFNGHILFVDFLMKFLEDKGILET